MKVASFGLCVVVSVAFSGSLAAQGFLPGGLESVELERIVPDTIVCDTEGRAALGNWEPYASVLGTSVFLVESNTFAENPTNPNTQRYAVTFQPVKGGDPVEGEAFFADDGTPYRGTINNYRQNGNPGRVAGDKRPGAKNFITGAETSAHEFPEFQSDDRWNTGVIRNGRYGTVQTFELDPETLEQKMLSKAFDAANGRLAEGDPGTDQISRFGGDVAALDDGNFVVVVDDRSKLHDPADKAAVAVIVAPDGSIVKDSFVIAAGEIWCNLAAFRGGFCVRVGGVLKFYDNSGAPAGEVDQGSPAPVDPLGNPVVFDRSRGDGTRIAAHVNSPYVFLAGKVGSDVRIAVWDARDLTVLAQANVNELTEANGGTDADDFRVAFDRVHLAADALNRVVVAYEATLSGLQPQTVVRVLAFDEEELAFKYLTPSFFAFVNFDDGNVVQPPGAPIRTFRPSVAVTTREILVAAKGEINGENDPTLGADTPSEANFYTVFAHPDPQDDPTTPAGGFVRTKFRRADANDDGKQDISDAVFHLSHLFLGGPRWNCEEGADMNGDGKQDISDPVFLLTHLFLGGAEPPPPYPDCGVGPEGVECPESSCNA
ncbi:MAG: hypothetical protein ACUVYA_11045 [Planctomycetota bacterium]